MIAGDRILLTTATADSQPRPRQSESGPGFSFFSSQGLARAFGNGGAPPQTIYHWKLLCLDLHSGDLKWEKTIRQATPTIPTHRSNSYASETPVTDGTHVYVYVGMASIECFDLEGRLVWRQPVKARAMQYGWGTGGSPRLFEDRLFLQCDNEQESFLQAYNKHTGETLWTVKRDELSDWSTPWVWHNSKRVELVTCGGKKVRSYDPQTGELLWQIDAHGRCATTATGDAGQVFVGSVTRAQGSRAAMRAIRAGAKGDLSLESNRDAVVWVAERAAPQLASPLLFKGCLYTLPQKGGILTCLDAATGQLHYRQRLAGAAGFTASPWACGDNVFCLDENGQTFVFAAGAQFKLVTTNRLDGMFWSSPAVGDGALVLRSLDHLYCIAQDP